MRERGQSRALSSPSVSVDADAGEVLRPALRRLEAFDLRRHRSGIEIVHDPNPGRLVDDKAVRLGEDLVPGRWIESFLRAYQEIVEPRIGPMAPILVLWRIAGAVMIAE